MSRLLMKITFSLKILGTYCMGRPTPSWFWTRKTYSGCRDNGARAVQKQNNCINRDCAACRLELESWGGITVDNVAANQSSSLLAVCRLLMIVVSKREKEMQCALVSGMQFWERPCWEMKSDKLVCPAAPFHFYYSFYHTNEKRKWGLSFVY